MIRPTYTGQTFDRKQGDRVIFLAGPTPREARVRSWRPQALRLLEEFLFDGIVIVPEHPESGVVTKSPEEIYAWEWRCLDAADVIAFWVPRHMHDFPGLTTNIEFGMFMSSSKIVLGAPHEACDMNYIRWACEQRKIPCAWTLEATMHLAVLATHRPSAVPLLAGVGTNA